MQTFPAGNFQGKTAAESSDQNLIWWANNAKSPALKAECIEEAKKRGIDLGDPEVGERQQQQPADQQAQRQQAAPRSSNNSVIVVGEAIAAGGNLMASLQRLSATCIIVAPTTAIDQLPEGCSVAISMIHVDPVNEGYLLDGDKKSPMPNDHIGLGKSAIERIGGGYGASWIPELTGRVDDQKDPHYCDYKAWVEFQDLDGTMRRYPGECEIDLRDGSPQVRDIERKAVKNSRDPKVQLAEARKFIQRQCMSKAMLVALRRPGLRHWYTRSELEAKPFACVKLMFHGRTQDPAYKAIFANIIGERFGNAKRQLFRQQLPVHSAPPVGTVPVVDITGEGEVLGANGERCPF